MRRNFMQRRLSWMLATIAIMLTLGVFGSAVAQSIGAKYGTRDPRTCADMKAPARGAITAALAAKYFICGTEKEEGAILQLVENVKVEVGGPRPYDRQTGRNFLDIDVKFPIYPIRGSHTQYHCKTEDTRFAFHQPGQNCSRFEHQKAEGFCYKTTFGEWRCFQSEQYIPEDKQFHEVAPPKGTTAANDPRPNKTPANPKTVGPPAVIKNPNQPPKTIGSTGANGIAKPDFSELEKDFEIVRYEYDTSTRPPAIFISAKVKRSNGGRAALSFEGRFYDANGVNVMIPAERVWVLSGDPGKVGDVVRLRAWTPSESQMRDKVKKIVITRIDE